MTANSNVTAFIEKAIALENNDFYKVLCQVAAGFQNKGFFLQSNFYEILKASFKNVDESEDEIENTFHISNSNGTTSSRLLQRKNIVVERENVTADMFDEPFTQAKPEAKPRLMSVDSNDSFEIPETQADPCVNDTVLDDDGDDFIAIPVEDIATNTECNLQSQDLLGGVALLNSQMNVSEPIVEEKRKAKAVIDDDFDSNDAIELEMSKLEYADTTKDEDEDDLRSASVTPDLDFDLLSSTKTCEIEVAPNLDLVQLKNEQTYDSKKITNMDHKSQPSNIDENLDVTPDDLVAVNSHKPETQPSGLIADAFNDNQAELNIQPGGHIAVNLQDVETQLFRKPDRPVAENLNNSEVQAFVEPHRPVAESSVDIATQLFVKSDHTVVKNVHDAETLLFVKPDRPVVENVHDAQTHLFVIPNRPVSKNLHDAETQLFVKPNRPIAATSSDDEPQLFEEPDLSDEENVYDVATQVYEKPARPVVKHSLDEDDILYEMATQKFEISKSDSRKRNSTGDDEPIPPKITKSALASSTKVKAIDVATENYTTVADQQKLGEIFKNEKCKFLETLKGSSWTKICSEANDKQLAVKFNVFDQCKEIQIIRPNDCETTTTIVEPIPNERESVSTIDMAAMEPVTRKSSRAKKIPRKYLEDVIAVTEMNIATGPNLNKDTSRNIKSPVSSATLANVKKTEPSKTSGDESGALLAVVNETKENNKASSRTNKNAKNTRSNQNRGDQTSTRTVSKQHAKSETSPVSSKSLADVGTEANERNGNDVATQLFVKTSKEQRKVSTRATKTVNTTTKTNQNQDDDDQEVGVYQTTSKTDEKRNVNAQDGQKNNGSVEKILRKEALQIFMTSTDAVTNRSRKRKAATTLSSIPSKISDSLSALHSPIPSSSSMNRSSRHQQLRVMFTMINPEPYKPILKRLNISMVDSDDTYDALVTDRVYRSSKFMCALASGKPIVSTEWLKALQERKTRVDPSMFLLKDKDGEKKYRFSLAKTIAKSAKQGFFHHHSILVTPNTSPSPEILKDVIVSSGGKYLKGSLHPRKDDQILCVSDRKDENVWPQLKKKYQNLKIINVEGFMQAIFQYNINVEEYGLN